MTISRSLMRRWAMPAAVVLGLLGGTATASAETYPSRRIELIVPWQAGGGADVVARALSAAASRPTCPCSNRSTPPSAA